MEKDKELLYTLAGLGLLLPTDLQTVTQALWIIRESLTDFNFSLSKRIGPALLVPELIFEEHSTLALQAKLIFCAHHALHLIEYVNQSYSPHPPRLLRQEIEQVRYKAKLFQGRFVDKYARDILDQPSFEEVRRGYREANLPESSFAISKPDCAKYYQFF